MKKENISVKEAAAMLGVSDFTIRRRIKDHLIEADMTSKKHGYKIPLDSLLNYAEEIENKNQNSLINNSVMACLSPSLLSFNIYNKASSFFKKILGNNNESNDTTILDNPIIIDKIIDRLNAEIVDLDLQIELQQLKIEQIAVDNKDENFFEKEKLIQIKQLKSNINKEIKDLEIQKAIITQNKGGFNESK